jgi:hypothetical protein
MTNVIGVETNLGRAWPLGSAFTFRVLLTDDGTASGTPTDLTGRDYKFVLRALLPGGAIDNTSDPLLSKTNGAGEISYTDIGGTPSAADVAILDDDLPIISTAAKEVHWTLWRTDTPNARAEAYGVVKLFDPGAQ